MAECSFARCQQERRAIRKELQRWTKNMVYILGLERVAEELMGRRKWKLYQDALIPKRLEGEQSSGDESMPATDHPPALKIKTIEQINESEEADEPARKDSILESLIKRPATAPKVEPQEPADWKPADKCYFCVDDRGERTDRAEGADARADARADVRAGGANSPASESDSSSLSGAKSPAGGPLLLQQLLQLQLQGQNPQAIAQAYTEMCVQFQQMIAALAALGSGLVPPALPQAWMMQRLPRPPLDRLDAEKVGVGSASPTIAEQPLDLSAKSTSSTSGTPPPENKGQDNARLKRAVLEGKSNSTRRNYTEDDLQSALRDIQSGLGTRRAAALYGIPRSTLRNKVNKHGLTPEAPESEDSDPEKPDTPSSVILKIPSFPPPEDKSPSPATSVTTPVTPITPILPPQSSLNHPSPLLLPASVYADPPAASQHLFTSMSDVIAKSICQKFQQPLDRPLQPDMSYMRAPDRHVSVIKTPPDNQRNYAVPSNSKATNNGQPAQGGKGTRPKRGKYRNYDRDSLVEAVKAVQRGEMSVHRAGSYYGVPHSTLEYKVKERHLMRPRKREPKPPQETKPQPPKPPPKPTKPFTNGLNGPEAPGYPANYPFWAGARFAPSASDLYTSHMMRRLHGEAPPANGFLEGIIRSSLEARPGAALLQRLTAEPRAEAPSLARRLAGEVDDEPAARRPRLDSDLALAAEMREAVQRLRADKLRPRNGTPTPPRAPSPAAPPAAPPHSA
ncbi:mushroom body large-type Kenyon cell-specific protein 1 isoform X1 [Pieris brassicae]|uniref:mushroom body large-type Kenyon cell-specific protein 1 isoform X1 n=2 Tax=Pieris brassicae TaxID=7116 RepID=UPI001E660BDC|nr:mushroom body large-type Kenyon cell-specific protein 1 isoform X1 [Pieris brassicae]XP_045516276.1 mushroom body large-type Kenyon cell-specific protein 1 isoform X1 [Pieris brassicae]